MSDDALLFEGLKVLDVGSWIAGPVAATMLADRGADVIKIEVPPDGDGYRLFAASPLGPEAGDVNYSWLQDARNKRSLSLNLKTDEGMAIIKRLIADCDVYVTNQPLPLRRKLGLMYDDIKSLNDKMIYASLTAYGEAGPMSENEAFDMIAYWNYSGMMNLMRAPGKEPVQACPGMGDHPTAVAMYAGIVTAMLKRERTGKGSFVHSSLLANGVWAASTMASGAFTPSDFNSVSFVRPGLALYETSDNRWMQLNMVRTEEMFDALLVALEAFDLLADERFASLEARQLNGDAMIAALREIFRTKTSDEWLKILVETHGLPVDRVTQFDELKDAEQLHINHMVGEVEDDVALSHVINDPVNVDGVKRRTAMRAPEVGEHSRQILIEMGYSDTDIESLRQAGVI